jgi:hypothetical protein
MGNQYRDPTAFQPREEREPCRSRVTSDKGAWAERTRQTGKLDPYSDIRSSGPGTVELPDTNKFQCISGGTEPVLSPALSPGHTPEHREEDLTGTLDRAGYQRREDG